MSSAGPSVPADGSDDLTDRFSRVYTGLVYDVMRESGATAGILPATIRPLDPAVRCAGRVFTVRGRREEGLDPHETLLAWTDFLTRAPAGHVVVCQPDDSELSHMGELSAETLKHRGVRGYIVDGGCRDTEFITDLGFPVWCRYATPADVVGRWVPDAFEVPIEIGGVRVHTGDYVVADRDGVVVVPGKDAAEVVTAAERAMTQENSVREAIRLGVSPKEAYLRHGKF